MQRVCGLLKFEMTCIRELTYLAIVVRIFLSILLGGMIGLERGLKNRPAGLRTYMLVCLGSCIVMITNQYVFQAFGFPESKASLDAAGAFLQRYLLNSGEASSMEGEHESV